MLHPSVHGHGGHQPGAISAMERVTGGKAIMEKTGIELEGVKLEDLQNRDVPQHSLTAVAKTPGSLHSACVALSAAALTNQAETTIKPKVRRSLINVQFLHSAFNSPRTLASSYHGHSESRNKSSSEWNHLSKNSSKLGEARNNEDGGGAANLPNRAASSWGKSLDCATIGSTRMGT